MYLLKLQMHKHGNSIYFTHDNMVCFPKSGHIYSMPIRLVLLVADDDNSTEITVTVSIHKILFKTL